jgi:transcriptional regulator with XRE-family HTH domain
MPRVPPDLNLVLAFLRLGQGLDQSQLARAAETSPNLVNDYERGRKSLNRRRLAELARSIGVPEERIDATLECLEGNRAASGPDGGAASKVEAVAGRAGRLAADFARSFLTLLTVEGEALQARQKADFLWARLEPRPPGERLALVETMARFRNWALCERAAAESIAAAPNDPRKALALAGLARRIAELVPGTEGWRQRLQGYAWAHVGNARRVCSDLPGAEEAMGRARKLWEAGAPADPGFLETFWLPGLEAALLKDLRLFPEALRRIEEALALHQGSRRAEILLVKAGVLEALGDSAGSSEVLREAALLIDPDRNPRLAFGVHFDLLVVLCRLGRATEAQQQIALVGELAGRFGGDLDAVRFAWLEGKIAAGLRRHEEARQRFQQVRQAFATRGLAFDYALVSLELALLLQEQGRGAEVRVLAQEMLWLFRAQGVHRETLAALRIFVEAARQEAATAGLILRVMRFLHRSQYDPELPFEEEGAEAG